MHIPLSATAEPELPDVTPALITREQAARFRRFAFEHALATDAIAEGGEPSLDLAFEANVGRPALAQLARIFDFEVCAIAILDEAQFRQRRVRLSTSESSGETTMAISPDADTSVVDLATAGLGLAGLRTSLEGLL